MYQKYFVIGVCLLACNLHAMNTFVKESLIPMYHAPSDGGAPNQTHHDMLAKVWPVDSCKLEGTIATLIARPASGWRMKSSALKLKKYGVEGDHRTKDASDEHRVDAVTLMRADVSDQLGGAPVPGDDMHVTGLDIGEMNLACGGLLVIKDPDAQVVKAILLKTYIEYYANQKIRNRCGDLAYDFLLAEGTFEKSSEYEGHPVHGKRDRLRGLKLAVLLDGEVSVGDRVFICTPEQSNQLLQEHKLGMLYHDLIQKSRPIAKEITKEQKKNRFERFMHRLRNESVCCGGLGIRGVLFMAAALGVVGLAVIL